MGWEEHGQGLKRPASSRLSAELNIMAIGGENEGELAGISETQASDGRRHLSC